MNCGEGTGDQGEEGAIHHSVHRLRYFLELLVVLED